MRILFDSKRSEYKTPFGVIAPEEICVLHLRIPRSVQTKAAQLVMEDEAGRTAAEFEFTWESCDGDYDIFRCEFSLVERGLYFYWFRISGATGSFRLFKQGDETNMEDGDMWQLSVVPRTHPIPEECMGRVMYQIFPDRFCREGTCDLSEKLRPFTMREDWGGQPEFRPNAEGQVLCNDFFGGNFRGIQLKLPYLKSLGVTMLYLNPISMAFSNHRYDTADYKRPDPMLGTKADFKALCDAAHELGMRVILDGVYSHTGCDSVYFDRYGHFGGNGACSGEGSPYYKWYTFRHFPDQYDCWWNFSTLPNVTELEPSYVDYIIENDDSVIAHWLKLGADGFRLDVVDELPDEFVRRFHDRLRSIRPDSLLYGEVWEDASNKSAYGVRRRYFVDRELDGTMNYPWQKAIIAFCKERDDGSALGQSIMQIAENYPADVLQCMMNLLGSHDTPRILTVLGAEGDADGDDKEALSRFRLTPEQRALASRRLRMASFLQFTLPGCPCVFYGDEAGVEGCKDPFSRACYPWGSEDALLQAHYRRLGALKNSSAALRRGEVRVVSAGGGRLTFLRKTAEETVTCYVNRSAEPMQLSAGELLYGDGVLRQDNAMLLTSGGCAVIRQ